MKEFENNAKYELSEEERDVIMMTLDQCLGNASDAQLEAIQNYALSIAPIPQAENVDKERVNELFESVADVLMSISDNRTPGAVAIAANEALGVCPNKELEARLSLSDYLNSCTATALQTGDLSGLEHMAKVVTTIHDLVGDYESEADDTGYASYAGAYDEEDDDDLF